MIKPETDSLSGNEYLIRVEILHCMGWVGGGGGGVEEENDLV